MEAALALRAEDTDEWFVRSDRLSLSDEPEFKASKLAGK
jgi:hypothetical protein